MIEKIVIQKRNDFYKLFSEMQSTRKGKAIELHLEVNSLAPLDILIITQFLIIQSQKKCELTIVTNPIIKEYVKAIKLVDFVKSNTYRPNTIRAISDFTAMPIRRVERERMVEYIHATERYFKQIIHGSKDLAMLNQCMSELINNVYDHSQSAIGAYVFCQYYPETNEIKMAVSDYGIGIPGSVNGSRRNKNQTMLSEIDSIKWAIKENNTVHSIPQNAGKGLDTVNSFVKENMGELKLMSGGAQLTGISGKNNYSSNIVQGFKGTVIQVTIKIDNLEAVDILDHLDWD